MWRAATWHWPGWSACGRSPSARWRSARLNLTLSRVQAGLDTRVEQHQAEAGLPDARAQIQAIDGQIALAPHPLAVPSGQAPQALDGLVPAPLLSGIAPLRASHPQSASTPTCWAAALTRWLPAGGSRQRRRA